jgi:hypothetical protein
MFHAIIKKLNGTSADPATLQATLADLDRERTATRAEIEAQQKRRHQALLDDEPDSVIDKIERELARATVRLEKLNVAEAPLRERIAAAKADAQKRAIGRHFDIIAARYADLRADVLKAEASQVALMQARDAAIAEVGEHAVNLALPIFAFGALLGSGHAQHFVEQNDGTLAAARAARARDGSPKKAPAAPKPATSRVVLPKRAAPAPRPAVTKAAPLGDDLSQPGPGEVAVRVLRSGYPDPSGRQCERGRRIVLVRDVAEKAAQAGAIEIIELSPAPAPTPATPATGANDNAGQEISQ